MGNFIKKGDLIDTVHRLFTLGNIADNADKLRLTDLLNFRHRHFNRKGFALTVLR